MDDGFARTYGVELLLAQTPQINKADLLTALRRRCGQVEPLDGSSTSDLLSFLYPSYPVRFGDQTIAAQTFLAVSPTKPDAQKMEAALQQSWDWKEARSAVAGCRSTLFVSDLMSSGLEYKARLALFQNVILAVLDIVPCLGIHWRPSQCLVNPLAYQEARRPDTLNPLFAAMNVRAFNISNRTQGEAVMDTLGLAALGIPDVQCHFTGLDHDAVARVLYNAAYYLFDRGDIIGDGETIQGIKASDRWCCQHEDALIGPERIVLDIDPGRPYAAGNRL